MSSSFHITILTCFPQMFPGSLQYSIAGLALKHGLWSYDILNIKDFGITKHKNIDDTPYGGGNGMVMRPDVLGEALDHAIKNSGSSDIYYMSPRGSLLKQADLPAIVEKKNIIILCGRFEGVDERVIDEYNIQEISIGDYILSGGEPAAMILIDACVRLIPGVLSNPDTLFEESFSRFEVINGMLEYPLYTKPANWRNRLVPDVLLSGDHAKIRKWKIEESLKITKQRRPDLLV